MSTTFLDNEKITISKEEYEELIQLNERLIEDKKEMEQDFKEILSNIVEEIETREKLGELLTKKDFESYKEAGLSVEKFIQTNKENETMMKELENKLKKLENSKLGKLQKKIWEFRNKRK